MKKLISLALAMVLILSLFACNGSKPEPTPEPAFQKPEELEAYLTRAEARFNMQYKDFAGYWSAMCDDYYGDAIAEILAVLPFPDKDREVESKRAEFTKNYGEGWHYEITALEQTPLDEKTRTDFAKELNDIADKADLLVNAAQSWSDSEWESFAAAHKCSVDGAKKLVAAFGKISAAARDKTVTDARDLTLTLSFTSGEGEKSTRTETDTVYCIDGDYVSVMMLDYSYALLNLTV